MSGIHQRLKRRAYGHLFNALGDRGLSTLYARRFAGLGVVFMFHRVVEGGAPNLYPGQIVTADELDRCLGYVTRAGWRVVTVDQLAETLQREPDGRRFVCFTFDDGYRDNCTVALPIFEKYNVPMCTYVSTAFIERTAFYWWSALMEAVLTHDALTIDLPNVPEGGYRLPLGTVSEKTRAFHLLDEWCHENESLAESTVRPFLARLHVDHDALMEQDFLNLDELRAFARHPLVTIGSHAVSHRRLIRMTAEGLADELVTSRRRISDWTQKPVDHLAYPFGGRDACGPREFAAAARAGYVTGVTTRRGNIFPEHAGALLALPRREARTSIRDIRNSLYGVSTLLRGEQRVHLD